MRKTNLIIKVREFGPSIDPYFGIETIIADDEKARMVTEKYNDIADTAKITFKHYMPKNCKRMTFDLEGNNKGFKIVMTRSKTTKAITLKLASMGIKVAINYNSSKDDAKETADKIMNDVEFIHYNSKYKNKDCVVKKITKTVEMEELECLERK